MCGRGEEGRGRGERGGGGSDMEKVNEGRETKGEKSEGGREGKEGGGEREGEGGLEREGRGRRVSSSRPIFPLLHLTYQTRAPDSWR